MPATIRTNPGAGLHTRCKIPCAQIGIALMLSMHCLCAGAESLASSSSPLAVSAHRGPGMELPLRVGVALSVVVLLILALAWLSRKTGLPGLAKPHQSTTTDLQALASLRLGSRERAVLLQVDEHHQVLVGIGPGYMTALATIKSGAEAKPTGTEPSSSHNISEDLAAFPAISVTHTAHAAHTKWDQRA